MQAIPVPTAAAQELPELHFDERYFRDPHGSAGPLLRAGARVARVPELGTLFFLRHADVTKVLLDRRFGAMGVRYYEHQGWSEGPYIEWVRRTLVFLDPPDHDRLRNLLSRAFTPRQVARVRPITREIADRLAGEAAEAREVDLYDAFAQRLPLQVICSLLGIPSIDFAEVGRWTEALSLATATPTEAERREADRAIVAFDDYVGALVAERRTRPGEDLLTELIAVEEDGDRLSKDELVAMVVQLLYAGHETTRNLIGNGLFALLQNPGELARLRREPELLQNAVEEMLRYEPPILFLTRIALGDSEVAGVPLQRGELFHLGLASANRDPDRYADPDRFDVGRRDNKHLSFGWGMHFCMGASIARMEGQVAFETLLRRFAKIELVGPTPPWAPATALRTLERFPVRLTSA
ncbi:MAG: cytochrome P450 [Myxococcales bacterium]|nr:MAG: cytochrome P450 [Myxococcales bacterium]